MIKKEIWKDIVGYKGYYQVSNLGRVKSLDRKILITKAQTPYWRACNGVMLKQFNSTKEKCNKNYKLVDLIIEGARKTCKVHRLVAEAFIPNINNKPCVNHIDGNKLNNSVDNLEWVTHKENSIHSVSNGLQVMKTGSEHPQAKSILQYDVNGNFIKEWNCIKHTLEYIGLSRAAMSKHLEGRSKTCGGYIWKYK